MKLFGALLPLLLGALLFLCGGEAVLAAATKSVPTTIKASRMQYDAGNQRVVFEGAVHVSRPDFELWSETLTVYLDKGGKGNDAQQENKTGAMGMGMDAGQVERIVAERNVRMKQAGRSGTCGKATYTVADGKIVMEYNPAVMEGPNQIRGAIINFYTRDNRSEVIGAVEANFVTTDKNGGPLPGRAGTRTRNSTQ